ncbi:hypothetical protein OH687_21455 [Burkholderia anthina]|nr:hypothetical protein OH687_21455 [Burkholderia anthina]
MVEQSMQLDPLARAVFGSHNRKRNRVKLLLYDRAGFWLMLKRLEVDRFACAREHVALGWHNGPFAEPIAIEQILHNLIQNARDALAGAGTSCGEVRVSGAHVGRHYRFSVVDNGPGVPDDVLPRLFEPFSTTRARRLGLGLPLCGTLAQHQDGALTVRNLPSGGVRPCCRCRWQKRPHERPASFGMRCSGRRNRRRRSRARRARAAAAFCRPGHAVLSVRSGLSCRCRRSGARLQAARHSDAGDERPR